MRNALSTYYGSNDPLGRDGDFITAPEISQLFGEIIGIWSIQQWVKMGSPEKFRLIELGPGRGTLMNDLLRGTEHVKKFHAALSLCMVETSSMLQQKQNTLLASYPVSWHQHLSEVNHDLPAIIIANEFFDALPIRQFQKKDHEWHEHYINQSLSSWKKAPTPPQKITLPKPRNEDIFEFSHEQEAYAKLLTSYHGAKIIIDYGYQKSNYGDTLQALYKHEYCAITDHIGHADITSHIDFEWIASFFKKTSIKTQSEFLLENGISIRYHQLNDPALRSGYERLIHSQQMGNLFQVLEIFE